MYNSFKLKKNYSFLGAHFYGNTKKQLKKHKKKEEKIRKTIYFLTIKNNKNIFLLFSKKWFLIIQKTQKIKAHSFFQKVFCIFCF